MPANATLSYKELLTSKVTNLKFVTGFSVKYCLSENYTQKKRITSTILKLESIKSFLLDKFVEQCVF